jgi:DNA uptake protein ComE-like DNA-binding protein
MYIEANNNRVTAATKLNAHSSRSHAVLRVKLTQTTGDMVRESTASAIDLAGSEDNRRTDNGKERLVESAAINKSLFVLSQCIDAISRGDKRIPYRESKMTRILSLGQNNGITVMILNLAPMRSYHLDTLSSLNVSSRAKRIEVREIENEVVFKQVAKATQGASTNNVARQPLRPLANNPNAHNVHNGNIAAKTVDVTRPVKAFAVFTDKPKATSATRPIANTTQVRRSSSHRTSTHKRASENENPQRPSKIAKPAIMSPQPKLKPKSMTVSAEQIEAMVEKKVSEILAAREAAEKQAPEAPQPQPQADALSKTVQKRLEALERRIESDDWRDDAKADGLRLLLAARQHKERGDDAAALEAYESALPYFPGQAKLLSKIERLRAKLDGNGIESISSPRSERKRRRRKVVTEEDEVSYTEGEADVEEGAFLKPIARRPRSKIVVKTLLPDDDSPPSPQAQQLLNIVNSRDIVQIRSLVGFGAKKAQDLVDYMELIGAEDGGRIETLAQLRTIPGLGGRAIERAYGGLVA